MHTVTYRKEFQLVGPNVHYFLSKSLSLIYNPMHHLYCACHGPPAIVTHNSS